MIGPWPRDPPTTKWLIHAFVNDRRRRSTSEDGSLDVIGDAFGLKTLPAIGHDIFEARHYLGFELRGGEGRPASDRHRGVIGDGHDPQGRVRWPR